MTSKILIRFLTEFANVHIHKKGSGYFIEADGESFDGSFYSVEEAFESAYFCLRAKKLAKELVKSAKVVL